MESRSHLIWRHTNTLINKTSLSWDSLAATVREHYEASVPVEQATIEWSQKHDAYTRARLDAQTLRRFEHNTKHGLPAELEESLVFALQALGYVGMPDLMRDLAGRYGLLAAPIPDTEGRDGLINVARVSQQFAEALEALSPMIADGKIDGDDRPYARNAIHQVMDVIAESTTLVQQINSIMADDSDKPLRAVK